MSYNFFITEKKTLTTNVSNKVNKPPKIFKNGEQQFFSLINLLKTLKKFNVVIVKILLIFSVYLILLKLMKD